jgi:3-methyladenine DNA glycosylase AlkD
MQKEIKARLKSLSDEKYRKFASGLLPGVSNMLGVRLPLLRSVAREIAATDWRTYLSTADDEFFEEVMLKGFIIGSAKTDVEERLQLVREFIPKISNWSLCDSFCACLKFVNENRELVWDFLQPYFNSDKEFELRFAVVMGIFYFTDEDHIDDLLGLLVRIKHDGYFVKMAVAWALSACFAKQPEKTLEYLKNSDLDDFTYNKALQKIIESKMTDDSTRNMIRGMKRKNRATQL